MPHSSAVSVSQSRTGKILIFSVALLDVQSKRAQMDMGIHIGWWGQLQGSSDPYSLPP